MHRREKILNDLDISTAIGVEIGPLAWPLVRKSDGNVTYVDFTDADSLREKHRERGLVPLQEIVDVDAIWGSNTLQQAIGAHRKVDYVIASHVIEHVPDLPSWLSELTEVLRPGGEVRLAVPDKRFTFDYLRRETELHDILAAYSSRTRVPLPQHVFDFALNYVEVDKSAAWAGPLEAATLPRRYTLADARDMVEACMRGEYVDIHCWVFTPRSFGELFAKLAREDLIQVECSQFFDTEHNEYEFFVGLRPCDDRDRIVESWEKMRDASRDDRIDQERSEIQDLKEALGQAEAALRSTVQQRDLLQDQVMNIKQSTSWKITRPLRAVVQNLRNR